MKSVKTNGTICIKDKLNIEYKVCQIEYILYEDESFKYIFTPNYHVISLLDSTVFQGIPGLDLDLRKDEYIRENIIPTFISERVPNENREDYYSLLEEVKMDYMNPIEYLIKAKKRYSGDRLYVVTYKETQNVFISSIESKCNNLYLIKKILDNIASGNNVYMDNGITLNNNSVFKLLIYLYERGIKEVKVKQKDGIDRAKEKGSYAGRKPIMIEEIKFKEMLEKVSNKEMSAKDAAAKLGISIDKYYRMKKKIK